MTQTDNPSIHGEASQSVSRKLSYRSEIKIHFYESIPTTNLLPPKGSSQKKPKHHNSIVCDAIRTQCQPTRNKFIFMEKTSPQTPSLHTPQILSNDLAQTSTRHRSSPSQETNISYGNKQKPTDRYSQGWFKRSSSVHSGSFLYPKSGHSPTLPVVNASSGHLSLEQTKDDSCIVKENSVKSVEKTKSTDFLYEESVVERRNESFKSCEKRHSICAMESESGDETPMKKIENHKLDTLSLKPGSSTLSISKPNWFVKKYVERQDSKLNKTARKSASCRDLGGVDCEGWLWKKQTKAGLKATKWVLWWCVLEKKELKFYKKKENKTSEGSIHIPGMRVAPAPELNNQKFAFKVFHSGHTFYFRAEKRDEMVKWMNKMGLASLSNFEVPSSKMIAGFQNEVDDGFQRSYSSDSDGNQSSSDNCSNSSISVTTSREDLSSLKRTSRSSENLQNSRDSAQIIHYQLRSKFINLNKLLNEKKDQLSLIEELFVNQPLTGDTLKIFLEKHSSILMEEKFGGLHILISAPSRDDSMGCENHSTPDETPREENRVHSE